LYHSYTLGTYEVCIDNEMSYTTKKVYLWLDLQREKSWDDEILDDDVIQKYQLKRDVVRVCLLVLALYCWYLTDAMVFYIFLKFF